MTSLQIDWTMMWKLFHAQFFWTYLAVGVLIRITSAVWLKTASPVRASLYAVVSSFVAALLSTWFPVVAIIGGLILVNTAGDAAGYSLPITVPVVTVSLGLEAAAVDAILFRLLLKKSAKGRLGALLIINLLNAVAALAILLMWVLRHRPNTIASIPWIASTV